MSKKNPRIGSSLDDFLKEEGILEAATTKAVKRVIAWQITQAMKEQGLTKDKMAKQMKTSRSALDRLLDPTNNSVTLATLSKAAATLGKRLQLELVDA